MVAVTSTEFLHCDYLIMKASNGLLFILKLRRFWICHCLCEMRLSIWMCYWTYNGIVVVFQKLSMRSVDCVACKHTKHTHSTKRKYWTSLKAERSSCNWRFHKLLNSRCTNPNDRYVNKNRKAFQICGMINIVNVLSFLLCTRVDSINRFLFTFVFIFVFYKNKTRAPCNCKRKHIEFLCFHQ